MDCCETCVYYPPSSCDGKPCTQCDITNPFLSCYMEKEFILDFQQEHKQTNADRIRAMTDEELTIFLAETSRCSDWCNLYEKCKAKPHDSYSVCLETWNDWLKEESEDE